MKKTPLTLVGYSGLGLVLLPINAIAFFSNLESVCLDDYNYPPAKLGACLSNIQDEFSASTTCDGVVVSASETVPTLAAQVSGCTITTSCRLVARGAGEGGSGGGGCGQSSPLIIKSHQ